MDRHAFIRPRRSRCQGVLCLGIGWNSVSLGRVEDPRKRHENLSMTAPAKACGFKLGISRPGAAARPRRVTQCQLLNNIPCPPLALQYLLTRSAGRRELVTRSWPNYT